MPNFLQKHASWLSLLINLLLFGLAYLFLYPSYGTVDDTEMQLVLSGQILTPEPQAQVRWNHWWIGYLLSSLYRLNNTVPWYGLHLFCAHFMSMWALLFVVLRMWGSRWRLALFGIVFLVTEIPLLQEVQYTSTAIVTASSGGILLWFALQQKGWQHWLAFGFSSLLLLWATAIRWEIFPLSVALLGLLLFHGVIYHKKYLLHLLQLSLVLGLNLGLLAINNYLIEQDAGWKKFYTRYSTGVHQAILDFHWNGYRWNKQTEPIYQQKVGWSWNDYHLYTKWFMADSSVYGLEKTLKIKAHLGNRTHINKDKVIARIWYYFYNLEIADYWLYCFLLMGLLLLGISFRALPGMKWVFIGTMVISLAIIVFMATTRHLPERVTFPIWALNVKLLLLMVGLQDGLIPRKKWVVLGIGALLAAATIKPALLAAQHTREQKEQWDKALQALHPQPDQLFVFGSCHFYEPSTPPLQPTFRPPHNQFKAVDFGHLSNTPTFYKQLQHFGIGNIFVEMIDHPKVYFVARQNSALLENYKLFIQEHYQREIEFKPYYSNTSLNIIVYRVVSQPMNPSTKND